MTDSVNEKPRKPGAVIFTAILNFITAALFLAAALLALVGGIFGNVMGIYDFL